MELIYRRKTGFNRSLTTMAAKKLGNRLREEMEATLGINGEYHEFPQ